MAVFGLIFVLLIVVPLAELFVIAQVAGGIGWLPTIGIVLAVSLIGAWLVRREGSGIWPRIRNRLSGANNPTPELVDGGLVIFGATLLLTPGFVTDAVGLAMMIPPIRAVARKAVLKRIEGKVQVARADMTRGLFTNMTATRMSDFNVGNPTSQNTTKNGFPPGFQPGAGNRAGTTGEVIDVNLHRETETQPQQIAATNPVGTEANDE